jgi:hypothetical protein
MHSNQPSRTGTAFEYFLYAAILVETGLAALIYKVIFRNAELGRLRVGFAIFYFAFLAWAIVQLNNMHRRRKSYVRDATPVTENANNRPAEASGYAFGLTRQQLVVVVVVFASAVAAFSFALRLLD